MAEKGEIASPESFLGTKIGTKIGTHPNKGQVRLENGMRQKEMRQETGWFYFRKMVRGKEIASVDTTSQ